MVIITRNIDLSVGSIAGVSAYLTGDVLGTTSGPPVFVAVLLAVAIGTVLGLINGALVAYGRIPSIIVTLGTLAIYRTWLISYAEARTITASSLPQWLVDLPRSTVFSIGDYEFRTMFVMAIVVVIVLQLLLGRLRAGRIVYAIGSNPEAALQSGLPVRRTTIAAFTACGALAGLGGFLLLARFGTLTVTAGQGLELESIAAAVVGGVSTLGGSGTIVGSFFGAVLIGLLDQSIVRVPADQRVRARRRARAAHPPRRRARRAAVAPLRPPAHDHGRRDGRRPIGRRNGGDRRCPRDRGDRWIVVSGSTIADVARRNPWETLLLVILAGTIVFNVTQSTNYLDIDNFVNLFELSIEKAIIVVMMTFVIISGEIDLSVASVMGLSAAVLAKLNDGQTVPFALAIVIAIAAGSIAGLVQGWCVSRLGLPSLVVTLAGLIGLRGLARVFVEDRSYGGFPSWFENLGQDSLIGPLPFAVILFLVCIVVGGVVLARTALGGGSTSSATTPTSPATRRSTSPASSSDSSSPRAPWPPSPACSTPPGSARCAATSPTASSSTSSRWCCSAASASSVVPGR